MSNTIVCNTLVGAVTEYDWPAFQSITPTHAGDATGLFAFGGDKDLELPIVADIRLPTTLRSTTLKKSLDSVYVSMHGEGGANFTIFGPGTEQWSYPMLLHPNEVTRCVPGKGIRMNYFGFGLSKPDGKQFSLDRVEVTTVESKNRRIGHGS